MMMVSTNFYYIPPVANWLFDGHYDFLYIPIVIRLGIDLVSQPILFQNATFPDLTLPHLSPGERASLPGASELIVFTIDKMDIAFIARR